MQRHVRRRDETCQRRGACGEFLAAEDMRERQRLPLVLARNEWAGYASVVARFRAAGRLDQPHARIAALRLTRLMHRLIGTHCGAPAVAMRLARHFQSAEAKFRIGCSSYDLA